MQQLLALTNATVLTGVTGQQPIHDAVVLIRDRLVDGVYMSTQEAQLAAAGPVKWVDVSGNTLLPGMIDCHVHLFHSGDVDAADVATKQRDVRVAAQRAAQHLEAGVTTVRDLNAPVPEIFELREHLADSASPAPHIIAAGAALTTSNGHGSSFGSQVRTTSEVVQTIKQAADDGVDCIKIIVSGGASTEGSDLFELQFSEDTVRAAADTAHELGLHVAAHASNPEAIRAAAAAGVDSVEHAIMIDDAALDALCAADTTVVATLTATALPPDALDDTRMPAWVREKARITVPAHRPSIRRAIAGGITMAGGTDAGSTLTPHGRIATEARELVNCGLSNNAAVAAVTSNAAELLGLGDQLGSIEAGKMADLVVVGGNPLNDIGHLNDVRLVVKDGQLHRVRPAA